jgi:hypothetical protein
VGGSGGGIARGVGEERQAGAEKILLVGAEAGFDADVPDGSGRRKWFVAEFDPVFEGGDEGIGVAEGGGLGEGEEVAREAIVVVVVKPEGGGDEHAEGADGMEEAVGIADAGEGEDLAAAGDEGDGVAGGVVEAGDGGALLEDGAWGNPLGEEAGGEVREFGGDLFAAGEHDHVGAFHVVGRFAPGAPGEDAGGAEGFSGVAEEDVEVALEAAVLEAVVEDEDVGVVFLDGGAAALDAVGVDDDGDAGAFVFDDEDFVRFAAGAIGEAWGAIAAGEDGGVFAEALEFLDEHDDGGGFAGAAGGDVSDGDDGDGEFELFAEAEVVEEVSGGDEEGVDPGGDFEEESEDGGECACAFAGDDGAVELVHVKRET